MFYVYSGYSCHYDEYIGPSYTLREFNTPEQVIEFKKQFEQKSRSEHCGQKIFRVIEGKERKMQATEVVKDWTIV